MAKPKFKFDKKKLLIIGGVILLIGVAAGIGFLARLLQMQTSTDTTQAPVSELPPVIAEVQDLYDQGKTEEAQKKSQESLNDPAISNDIKYMIHIQQGSAQFNAENYQGAIDEYKKALSIKETYEIVNLLAESYAMAGNSAEAINFYKQAHKLVPSDNPVAEDEKASIKMKIEALGGAL